MTRSALLLSAALLATACAKPGDEFLGSYAGDLGGTFTPDGADSHSAVGPVATKVTFTRDGDYLVASVDAGTQGLTSDKTRACQFVFEQLDAAKDPGSASLVGGIDCELKDPIGAGIFPTQGQILFTSDGVTLLLTDFHTQRGDTKGQLDLQFRGKVQ